MNEERLESRLKTLFDFQRFAGNARLAKIIKETESKYKKSNLYVLSDSDLASVNAAGEVDGLRARHLRGEDDDSKT